MNDIVEQLRDRTFPMDQRDRCQIADEIDRLRADLALVEQGHKSALQSVKALVVELKLLKALLREVLDQCRETDKMQWDGHLYRRIREVLGEP